MPEKQPASAAGQLTSKSVDESILFAMIPSGVGARTQPTKVAARPAAPLILVSVIGIATIVFLVGLFLLRADQRLMIGIMGAIIACSLILWLLPKWQIAWLVFESLNDRFVAENEARKTIAQVLGGLIFLVGFYFTAENLRNTQAESAKSRELTRLGQLNERLAKAIEQLVEKDSPESSIIGCYSLGQIALESPADAKTITEVLTAYVRLKSPWSASKRVQSGCLRSFSNPGVEAALIQLRLLTRQGAYSLDLSRAAIYQAALSDLNLANTDLNGADLSSIWLRGVDLSGANLVNARLGDSDLSDARIIGADLYGIDLSSTVLSETLFNESNLAGVKFGIKSQVKQTQIDAACFSEDDAFLPDTGLALPSAPNSECVVWKRENNKLRTNKCK